MRKKIKKPVHVMIIAVIAICVFVPLISSILKGCGGAGTGAQEGTTSQSSTRHLHARFPIMGKGIRISLSQKLKMMHLRKVQQAQRPSKAPKTAACQLGLFAVVTVLWEVHL